MDFITEDNKKEFDYVTFPRQFDTCRWYKPLFTIVLFLIFYILMSALLLAATCAADFMWTGGDLDSFISRLTGGYDNLNIYDATGAVLNLGLVALMIPALALARVFVRDRSFSSYTSSRGGWSHGVFIKCLLVALIIIGVPIAASEMYPFDLSQMNSKFTQAGIVLVIVLGPLQCIAEEYVFRGLITQTLGSWFRVPIIAIVLSSLGFAALHPYNRMGQIAIFITGIMMGLSAWLGRGIEVSSAMHIVSNMASFILTGLGFSEISSDVDAESLIFGAVIDVLYVLAIWLLSRKTDWFDRIRYYDAADWNEGVAEKKARKAAKKAAKKAARQAKKEEEEEKEEKDSE